MSHQSEEINYFKVPPVYVALWDESVWRYNRSDVSHVIMVCVCVSLMPVFVDAGHPDNEGRRARHFEAWRPALRDTQGCNYPELWRIYGNLRRAMVFLRVVPGGVSSRDRSVYCQLSPCGPRYRGPSKQIEA